MPLQLKVLTQGSFEGMSDSLDAQTGAPRKAKLLQNVYPLDPEKGGGCTGRPGFVLSDTAQLGVTASRVFQRFYQYTKLDGTEITLGFCGGKMYRYHWTNRQYTNVAFTTGIAIPTSGHIYCATFNNQLVVNPSDGTNKPFTWDGTTFTSLTNASTAFGPIAIYYGKLFLIKWAERSTLIWSEENQPNVGYEAGGYNNSWTLSQTEPNPLYAIWGTNAALFYWRARSLGAISGAVNADFTTTGVHDALSQNLGTQSPAAMAEANGTIFFLDADGRPHALTPGSKPAPLWSDLRNTLALLPRSSLGNAVACHYSPIPVVLFGFTESGQTAPTVLATVSPTNGFTAGLWRGLTTSAMDMVLNGSGVPTLLFGGTDGYGYELGAPDGTVWSDGVQAGAVAINHTVQGSYLGWDPRMNKHFDRVVLSLRALSPMTNLTFDYQTPEGEATSDSFSAAGSFALWNQGTWDSATWATTGSEVVQELGIDGDGRWILPRLTHQGAPTERFGLNYLSVESFITVPVT